MEDNLRSYTTVFFYEANIFPDDFMKYCNNNKNQSRIIPIEVENNMKIMSMEQGLYAKVVMLCRNNLKITGANKNKNEDKFKFQGQSERS